MSTNKIYAGIHWSQRKKIKDDVIGFAAAFCRPLQQVDTYPIEIKYRFFFVTRPLDTLNCAAIAKMFEDALCALGVIKDDGPKYVTRAIIEVIVLPKLAAQAKKKIGSLGPAHGQESEDQLEIIINQI
jgi:hypothetical protein